MADYHRQYVGMWVEGRRSIYINSVRSDIASTTNRATPELICDGFELAWGALYDIEEQSLSHFSINGGF